MKKNIGKLLIALLVGVVLIGVGLPAYAQSKQGAAGQEAGEAGYTVKFTYNGLTHVMQGNTSVALTDVLNTIGLSGHVTAVEVSDPALFSAEQQNGIWEIIAHQPFSTAEWMKATIDGTVYEITVTDDQVINSTEWWSGNKTDNYTIGENGQIRGGTFTATGGTIINNRTTGFAIIVTNNNNYEGKFSNETLKNNGGSLAVVWNKAKLIFTNNSKIDGMGLDYSQKTVLQTSDTQSKLAFEGNVTIENFKNAVIRNGANGSSYSNVDMYIENGATLTVNNSTITFTGAAAEYLNLWGNGKLVANDSVINSSKIVYRGNGNTISLNNSTLDTATGTLAVQNNGVLELKNGSSVIGKATVKSGSTLILDGPNNNTNNITLENGAHLVLKNGASYNVGTMNLGSVTAEGAGNRLTGGTLSTSGNITVKENGELTMDRLSAQNTTIVVEPNATLNVVNQSTLTSAANRSLIQNNGTANIENSTIHANRTNDWTINNLKNMTVSDSTINIPNEGTGISSSGGTLLLDSTEVKLNGAGRGFRVTAGSTVTWAGDTEISGLDANANYNFVARVDGATLNIEGNTNIHNNKNRSGEEAGKVILVQSGGAVNIKNGTFTENETTAGGLLHAVGADVNIEGGIFTRNHSTANGGVIYGREARVNVTGGVFTENDAVDYGGAMHLDRVNLTIGDGVVFEKNNSQFGGALSIEKTPSTTIGKAQFVSNGAQVDHPDFDAEAKRLITRDGGAIIINGGDNIVFEGTVFDSNKTYADTVLASGGAIFTRPADTNIQIRGAKFLENSCLLYGGAMVVHRGVTVTITDLDNDPAEFIGNAVLYSMDFGGGAISIHGPKDWCGKVYMSDAAIFDNWAEDGGGGISTCESGTTNVHTTGGAAIFDNKVGPGSCIEDGGVYEDILFFRHDSVETVAGESSIYERMFNGALHNWTSRSLEQVDSYYQKNGTAILAKSNPSNIDISGAKVIFTQNKVYNGYEHEYGTIATGGAIANNGLLEIGALDELKLFKTWKDEHNATGIRPTMEEYRQAILDGKLTLLANGEPIDLTQAPVVIDVVAKEMNTETDVINDQNVLSSNILYPEEDDAAINALEDADTYMIIISGLPGEDESGNPITYSVEGDDIAPYEVTVDGRILTNTAPTIDVAVEKTWIDEDNTYSLRPDSITVHLLDDGEEVKNAVVTPDAQGNWRVVFTDLQKYKKNESGEIVEIAYTVEEDAVTDYSVSYEGTYDTGLIIKNTLERTAVTVIKEWDDDENRDGIRPVEIEVELVADGVPTGKRATLSEENDWTHTFTDLVYSKHGAEVKYTVIEPEDVIPAGYTATSSGDAAKGFTIINHHAPQRVSIDVAKVWDDEDNQDGIRADSITVELWADGENTGLTVTLNEDNGWKDSFKDLLKMKEGQEIQYTVVEQNAPEGYTAQVKGDMETGFIITNSYVPDVRTIAVAKVWDDGDNQDGIRPDSITVELWADGENTGLTVTLNEENGWKDSFKDLPRMKKGQEIQYTVVEQNAPEGYTAQVKGDMETGFTVTNSYVPDVRTIAVSKVWDDGDNQDGVRPDSITVELWADGENTGLTVTLNEENGWKDSFKDLPRMKEGQEIQYTVVEQNVPKDYDAAVEGDMDKGFAITNTYVPDVRAISVTKVWDDKDNQGGKRPDSITVELWADGENTGLTVTLNEENGWKDSFKDLPRMKEGQEIRYTVVEQNVPKDYDAAVEGDMDKGFTITNTYVTMAPPTGDIRISDHVLVMLSLLSLMGIGVCGRILRSYKREK